MRRGRVLAIAAAVLAAVATAMGSGRAAEAPGATAAAEREAKRAQLRAGLERTLTRLSGDLRGSAGYLIRDLDTGETFEKDAGAAFPAASTIKLPIALELYRQAGEAAIDLAKPLAIDPRQRVGGGGVLEKLPEPYPPLSAAHLAALMMDFSDNFATNILIELVGLERVGRRMAAWGCGDTRLRRVMMDRAAARAGRENLTTPRDMARLLERLWRGELLTPEHTRTLLAIMARNPDTWIKRGLPPSVEVADKEGDLEGVRCDAGLVFVPGKTASEPPHPVAMAVMTAHLTDGGEGVAYIGAVARAAYDYFSVVSRSSEHGRLLAD